MMVMRRHQFQVGVTTGNTRPSGMLHLIRESLFPRDKTADMLSQTKLQSVISAVRVTTGQILKRPSVVGGLSRGTILRMEGR